MRLGSVTRLTHLDGMCWSAMFSPDSSKIVFCHYGLGRNDLYLMDRDGANLRRLTDENTDPENGGYAVPHLSPDGNQIVCEVYWREEDEYVDYLGGSDIYLLDLMSGEGRPLTSTRSDSAPRFSPDGESIVFVSPRSGLSEIYRMNAKGEEQTRLTHSGVQPALPGAYSPGSYDPCYSPYGEYIVYSSAAHDPGWHKRSALYRMRSDGSEQTRLIDSHTPLAPFSVGGKTTPVWNPQQTLLAFEGCVSVTDKHGTESGRGDVFLRNADGSGEVQSIYPSRDFSEPYHLLMGSFSADGRYLACTWQHTGYYMHHRGESRIVLYDTLTQQIRPAFTNPISPTESAIGFSPDGKTLLFTARHDDYHELYSAEVLEGV